MRGRYSGVSSSKVNRPTSLMTYRSTGQETALSDFVKLYGVEIKYFHSHDRTTGCSQIAAESNRDA